MLQFLKKTSRKKKDLRSSSSTNNVNEVVGNNLFKFDEEINNKIDDDFKIDAAEKFVLEKKDSLELESQQQSKLSRNLADILIDKTCLCYFVQYLEGKQVLALIKFWLDVESFRTSAETATPSFKTPKSTPNAFTNGGGSPSTNSIKFKYDLNDLNRCTSSSSSTGGIGGGFLSGGKRKLNKSVSSDGYDSLSYSSFDCDTISNNFNEKDEEVISTTSSDDQKSVDDLSDTNRTITSTERDDILRWHSLTDDEKTKIRDEKHLLSSPAVSATTSSTASKFHSSVSSDAIRIYRKYLITDSNHHIEIPATILSNISLSFGGMNSNSNSPKTKVPGNCDVNDGEDDDNDDDDEELDDDKYLTVTQPTCFDDAQNFVFERLEHEHLTGFLESTFYCKYIIDVLTNEQLQINDILYNEQLLFYFMEFLERYNQRHYLDFLLTGLNFKINNLRNFNYTQTQSDAMVIYEKYFSLQATNSLGLTDTVRYLIEENICKEVMDDCTIVDCFNVPLKIVEYYLNKKYFKSFLKSNYYYKYLKEMFNRIHVDGGGGNNNQGIVDQNEKHAGGETVRKTKRLKNLHRKTFSDCTNDSTKFIRTQNTLLAMESKIKLNKNVDGSGCAGGSGGMQIDSRHLYDPDLLWQRKNCVKTESVLSLGRITSLGRYERNFDMNCLNGDDDNRWSGNRLKNVVKKLVNLPEDRAQEELAWQVAEMIVKDITNVTLKNDKYKSTQICSNHKLVGNVMNDVDVEEDVEEEGTVNEETNNNNHLRDNGTGT